MHKNVCTAALSSDPIPTLRDNPSANAILLVVVDALNRLSFFAAGHPLLNPPQSKTKHRKPRP
jgi:hypothetical protein